MVETLCFKFSQPVFNIADIFENVVVIAFQIFSNVVFTAFHTVSQFVPNHPSTTSAACLIPLSANEMALLMLSHTVSVIDLIASKHPCQSPLKSETKKSIADKMTSSVVLILFDIKAKVVVMIGSRKSHRPCQISCMAFVISSNVMPRSSNLFLTPSTKSETVCFMPFQISVTLFLKSSFVFHNVTTAAVITPIAATAIPIGDVNAPITVPRLLKPVATPPAIVFSPPSGLTKVPMIVCSPLKPVPRLATLVIIPPMPVVSFPPASNSGPMAVTTAPIFTMVSFVPSSRSANFCTHSCMVDTVNLI